MMRASGAYAIASLTVALCAQGALAVATNVPARVPGVRIPVRLTERLSSQEATAGQHFAYETTAEVTVGGADVPSGTPGDGVVVVAQSGRGRNPGKMQLAVIALHPRGGKAIAVGLAPSEAGTKNAYDRPRSPAFAVPTVVGTLVLGGIVHDTNVVYEKGTAFTVIAPPPATPPPEPSPAAVP
ncbi:MAG: hypothetical protein M3R44_07435 [Candidatus Eremiobacteraeota bacterium]|nr:hypothetical protein [Candidatus Eremiobacteraeota bacterium]